MRTLVLLPLLLAAACGTDPVHDNAVDALGGEKSGVPEGPTHRPGQPCVVCHGGHGPAEMEFALAGTVYQAAGAPEPLVGGYVYFVDFRGKQYKTATNCAGNFFVQRGDYDPVFPVFAKIEYAGIPFRMESPIYRERSCAGCHGTKASQESVGPIYFSPAPFPAPPNGCPK